MPQDQKTDMLCREREGLQLAKFFLGYCFNVSDMFKVSDPSDILKALVPYGLKMCDDCGGAMCDTYCPVSRYIEDVRKWLDGERTTFATDRTKRRNCDVGTSREQSERFKQFCKQHKELKLSSYQCSDNCPCLKTLSDTDCEFAWSQMPYELTEEQNDGNNEKLEF